MVCPVCSKKYIDPPFQCVECAAEIGWRCPGCEHGNPMHYHYCGKCGSAIPIGLSMLANKGEETRQINIPQYDETELSEMMDERLRIVSRKKIRNLNQNAIDDLFG